MVDTADERISRARTVAAREMQRHADEIETCKQLRKASACEETIDAWTKQIEERYRHMTTARTMFNLIFASLDGKNDWDKSLSREST